MLRYAREERQLDRDRFLSPRHLWRKTRRFDDVEKKRHFEKQSGCCVSIAAIRIATNLNRNQLVVDGSVQRLSQWNFTKLTIVWMRPVVVPRQESTSQYFQGTGHRFWKIDQRVLVFYRMYALHSPSYRSADKHCQATFMCFMYTTRWTLDGPKIRIQDEIRAIPTEMLQGKSHSSASLCTRCG